MPKKWKLGDNVIEDEQCAKKRREGESSKENNESCTEGLADDAGDDQDEDPHARKIKKRGAVSKWGVLLATLLGSFMVILNNSLMNVALPYFMTFYQLTAVEAQWIVTSFALAMAISMPLTGYLGKVLGQKNVYLLGIGLFLAGSLLGAMAWNFNITIVFRALQGIGGGLVMPLALILIFKHFPKNERGMAMGIWGISAMMAPTIGPTIGGVILNYGDWPWLFLINIPTVIVAAVASWYFLTKQEHKKRPPFDWTGFALISVGLVSLMVGIELLQSHYGEWWVIALIANGVSMLGGFVWNEMRVATPLLDLRVLRNMVFTASLVLVACSTTAMFSILLLIPLLIQDVLNYSPLTTGLILFPQALASGLAMTLGGRILDKRGPYIVILCGIVVLIIATFAIGSSIGKIGLGAMVFLLIIQGFGNGWINTPATTAGLNALTEKQVPAGSAFNNVARQLVKVSGIVFISMFFEARRGVYMTEMPVQEAGILAVQQSFFLVGILLTLCLPLVLALRKRW